MKSKIDFSYDGSFMTHTQLSSGPAFGTKRLFMAVKKVHSRSK